VTTLAFQVCIIKYIQDSINGIIFPTELTTSSLDCYENAKAAPAVFCRAEWSTSQAEYNDNHTPAHVGRRRDRTKYVSPYVPKMRAASSTPV
jgi:hypothetical protein